MRYCNIGGKGNQRTKIKGHIHHQFYIYILNNGMGCYPDGMPSPRMNKLFPYSVLMCVLSSCMLLSSNYLEGFLS